MPLATNITCSIIIIADSNFVLGRDTALLQGRKVDLKLNIKKSPCKNSPKQQLAKNKRQREQKERSLAKRRCG